MDHLPASALPVVPVLSVQVSLRLFWAALSVLLSVLLTVLPTVLLSVLLTVLPAVLPTVLPAPRAVLPALLSVLFPAPGLDSTGSLLPAFFLLLDQLQLH